MYNSSFIFPLINREIRDQNFSKMKIQEAGDTKEISKFTEILPG